MKLLLLGWLVLALIPVAFYIAQSISMHITHREYWTVVLPDGTWRDYYGTEEEVLVQCTKDGVRPIFLVGKRGRK